MQKVEPMRRRRRGFTGFEQRFLVHLRFGTLSPPFDRVCMSFNRMSKLLLLPVSSIFTVLRRFVANGHNYGKSLPALCSSRSNSHFVF